MRALLPLLLLCACLACQGEPVSLSFRPDRAPAVEALVRPHALDTLELAGHRLNGVSLGPACGMVFRFTTPTGEAAGAVELRWEGGLEEGAPGGLITHASGPAGDDLSSALLALIGARLTPAFFRECCQARVIDPEGTSPQPEARAPRALSPSGGLPLLALALAAVGLVVARRRSAQASGDALPAIHPRDLAWLGGLITLALAPRLAFMLMMGPDNQELGTLEMAVDAWTDLIYGSDLVWYTVHPPGHPALVSAWSWVGSLFGLGGELWWLRLPNLAAVALLVLTLDRIGRALEIQHLTRPATVLLALLPEPILVGSLQANYLWEATAALVTLERGLAILLRRQPAWSSFAAAALLASWMGFLSTLVVLPLTAAVLLALLRRRALLAAASLLVFLTAGHVPLMRDIQRGSKLLARQQAAPPEGKDLPAGSASAEEASPAARLLHAPHSVTTALYGRVAVGLTMIVLGLVVAARNPWAAAAYMALIAAYAAMGLQIPVRWVNMALLHPWLALMPLWGTAVLGERALRRASAARRARVSQALVWGVTAITLGLALHARAPVLAEWTHPVIVHDDDAPWSPGLTSLDGAPGPSSAASWLFVPPVPARAVRALVQGADDDQPLVVLDPVPTSIALGLCPELDSLVSFQRCMVSAGTLSTDTPLPAATLGRRAVIHLSTTKPRFEGHDGCPEIPFARLRDMPSLAERPWLLWLSGGYRQALADAPACTRAPARSGISCRPWVEARNLTVLVCRAR